MRPSQELPQIEATIQRVGAFRSMVFKGADGDEMEIYEVTFNIEARAVGVGFRI